MQTRNELSNEDSGEEKRPETAWWNVDTPNGTFFRVTPDSGVINHYSVQV